MSGYLYTLIALRDGQTLGWIVGGRKWLELSPNLPARACPQRITSPSRTPVSLCDVKVDTEVVSRESLIILIGRFVEGGGHDVMGHRIEVI